MIQKCIEANPAKFARYAKVATVIGWVLLITSGVMLLPTLFRYCRVVRQWNNPGIVLFQIITPTFFGMFFLLLGQFLKYELGLEKQPGWFFRNGVIILRGYAAVVIGAIILQYAMLIVSLVRNNSSFGSIFLSSFSMHLFSMLNIAKVLLFWGLAEVTKMMMGEIRKKGDTTPNMHS